MDLRKNSLIFVYRALRIGDWWSYIIPPILAIGYLSLLKRGSQLYPSDALMLLCLLLSSVGMGCFGFLLNQWTDREEDSRAGKLNTASNLSSGQVYSLFAVTTGMAIAPWVFISLNPVQWTLIALQFISLLLYHIPPVRAKNYSLSAILLDSSYSSLFYPLLAWSLFQECFNPLDGILVGWCLARGSRSYLLHLLQDAPFDARSGRSTLAHQINVKKIIVNIIYPLEATLGMLWLIGQNYSLILLLLYGLWSLLAFNHVLQKNMTIPALQSFSHFWEIILPYSVLILLAVVDWQPWLLIHVVLFPRPIIYGYRYLKNSLI
jgi:hypothetical protein